MTDDGSGQDQDATSGSAYEPDFVTQILEDHLMMAGGEDDEDDEDDEEYYDEEEYERELEEIKAQFRALVPRFARIFGGMASLGTLHFLLRVFKIKLPPLPPPPD